MPSENRLRFRIPLSAQNLNGWQQPPFRHRTEHGDRMAVLRRRVSRAWLQPDIRQQKPMRPSSFLPTLCVPIEIQSIKSTHRDNPGQPFFSWK
jgi:hypothetical protein